MKNPLTSHTRRWLRRTLLGGGTLFALLLLVFAGLLVAHARGVERAEQSYRSARPGRLRLGETTSLRILPLVDWHVARPGFRGEMGVAYLVKTDGHRVLFDVGHNAARTSPSPLEHNMQQLGLDSGDFDTVVISHNHFDHVGGRENMRNATFSLGSKPVSLAGKRAFVPVPMTYPGIEPVYAPNPVRIGEGIGTTGTIPRQLFFGWIDELALAVNVRGRGIVLIVGCGHQGLPRLLERAKAVFDEPLYGIIGGLHLPVPDGRLSPLGINLQRLAASGAGPLDPLTEREARAQLRELRALSLGVVSLGGHDSSDEMIAAFRRAFGAAYQELQVGRAIVVR